MAEMLNPPGLKVEMLFSLDFPLPNPIGMYRLIDAKCKEQLAEAEYLNWFNLAKNMAGEKKS